MSHMEDTIMVTYVTNASVREAAQLVSGTSATVRGAASDIEDVTIVQCRDEDAVRIVAAFRNARRWLDRSNPPRPPRGGTRRIQPTTPLVVAAPAVLTFASDVVRRVTFDGNEPLDCLMRRASR